MTTPTTSPLSVFPGQAAQLRGISKTHGIIRPNMVESVDYKPKIDVKNVEEYDNLETALLYSVMGPGEGKLGFTKNNQGNIEALLMDQDVSVAPMILDSSLYVPFTLMMNYKGLDGVIKRSVLLKNCTTKDRPTTGTAKDAEKGSIDFMYTAGYEFMGLGMNYTRCGKGTAPQTIPSAPTVVAATTTGSLVAGIFFVRITAVTADGETPGSNEVGVSVASGVAGKLTITIPAAAGAITGYNVYVSDKSNGERFAAYCTTTSQVITTLPPTTAALCPNVDTTGVFAATGDLAFAGSPNAVTPVKAPYFMPQTGLPYALVRKNGVDVASFNNPATAGGWFFSTTQFILQAAPSALDVYDLFTLYQP